MNKTPHFLEISESYSFFMGFTLQQPPCDRFCATASTVMVKRSAVKFMSAVSMQHPAEESLRMSTNQSGKNPCLIKRTGCNGFCAFIFYPPLNLLLHPLVHCISYSYKKAERTKNNLRLLSHLNFSTCSFPAHPLRRVWLYRDSVNENS